MIQIQSISDIFSLIPLCMDIYCIFSLDFRLFILIIFSLVSHYIIKNITTGYYPLIFKRPDGACNCSLYNTGGNVSMNSGFPSGHVTTTSLFMNYFLFQKQKITLKDIILYNIPCLLVAIGRYYKKCHNIIQICAGYLLGLLIVYLDYHIIKKYSKTIKND